MGPSLNHPGLEPVKVGANSYLWEMKNLPAVGFEPDMPPLAPVLALTYFAPGDKLEHKSLRRWSDVSQWYTSLATPQVTSSPDLQAKVRQLTAGLTKKMDKVRAVGRFVQEISYCAIELGTGKYKPYAADVVFKSRCGDCKDKATLMRAMLKEAGIPETYHVLIRGKNHGAVKPEFPSPYQFNHCIVGVRLAAEESEGGLFAVKEGILFFDPTHPLVPVGYLPWSLQGVHALVADGKEGKLILTPAIDPGANMTVRSALVRLAPSEPVTCAYAVEESLHGLAAAERRGLLLHKSGEEQRKNMESYVSYYQAGAVLDEFQFENLADLQKPLIVKLKFHTPRCADRAGSLLFFSPKILGGQRSLPFTGERRQYPIAFDYRYRVLDRVRVEIPGGFRVDELPAEESISGPLLEFKASYATQATSVQFSRSLNLKETYVPAESYKDVKASFEKIRNSDLSKIVLKAEK